MTAELSTADLAQLAGRGIDARDAERQLRLLREPPHPPRLLRPCTVGDGIRRLDAAEQAALREVWQDNAAGSEALKLVPASGAASRMFGSLLPLLDEEPFPTAAELSRRAEAGDASARDLDRLWRELPRFPFFDELAAVCAARGTPLAELRERRDGRRLLRLLLGDDGLGLASRPKGLIPFHHYRDPGGGSRTAAEEHLWEGAGSLADDEEGVARYHFTVAPEERDRFAAELAAAADRLRRARGVVAEVSFSVQDPATDTLAITPEGEPFRDDDGSLLLRPGGHGALLANLAALPARWVLLKNVDNVQPERAHELVAHWQEVLGGLLVRLEIAADDHLDAIFRAEGDDADEEEAANAAARFLVEELGVAAAAEWVHLETGERERRLRDRLHRPLRVCGVVENRGEPGGGPFWVERGSNEPSMQIVERAEIGDDPAQAAVFGRATHFNPVQIAAGLRDGDNRPFDLHRYVDERAVFIARKSHGGRPLLALERPGLWNGAMAMWNTVFVEVPAETFAPVKTIFDLLRPEHQP
ncbi:MAG TPA: DUF4301 family protein [Thermoanaerobaculia bacterium]|nr:DUF4301 family protein [Thermoanaerobaculia bacterium]